MGSTTGGFLLGMGITLFLLLSLFGSAYMANYRGVESARDFVFRVRGTTAHLTSPFEIKSGIDLLYYDLEDLPEGIYLTYFDFFVSFIISIILMIVGGILIYKERRKSISPSSLS